MTIKHENFHNADQETYDRLVGLFTEQSKDGTRWVSIGAGNVTLTFFAPQVSR